MINEYIEKYYNGECSEEEKEKILRYFREHPAEMERFLSEEEWDAAVDTSVNKTPATENFLEQLIDDEAVVPKRKVRWGKWLAAAAIIAFISLASFYLFYSKEESADARLAVINTSAVTPSEPAIMIQKNDQAKPVSYKLPDGSIVTLSPNSEIKYARLFDDTKRDIMLEGEAVFQVAKDAHRPFTVYCKEVATTALGTKFRVSALKDNQHVSVVLMEGKIVVKSTATAYIGSSYYLLPGNTIQYDRKNSRFTFNNNVPEINKTPLVIAQSSDEEMAAIGENIKIDTEKKTIRFNDVRLGNVLNVLSYKYNVLIAYPPDRVGDIRFVGTISQSDPIKKILSDLTQINNLELIYDTIQHRYIIK